jgi:GTPase
MVLIDTIVRPRAAWEFTAEVLILHHPTTIQPNYQPVIHCFTIRQSAKVRARDDIDHHHFLDRYSQASSSPQFFFS